MVNNGALLNEHEFNAKIIMNLTQAQFDLLKQNAISKSLKRYSLIYNNCTDYALDLFNSVRATPIASEPIIVPIYNVIYSSPPGLYNTLNTLKSQGGSESQNIEVNVLFKPMISHGECP